VLDFLTVLFQLTSWIESQHRVRIQTITFSIRA
jgi:hypothetical protein